MRILEDRGAITSGQHQFENVVRSMATESIPVTIGFQGGNTEAIIHWLPSLGIWAYFSEPPLEKSPGERYWSTFGIGKPSGMVPIACEINSPKSGLNRQAAGAYAESSTGKVNLVHRGIFTARGRVPLAYARSHFRWSWAPIQDGKRTINAMVLGELNSPQFGDQLRAFILEVARFKSLARSHPWKKAD